MWKPHRSLPILHPHPDTPSRPCITSPVPVHPHQQVMPTLQHRRQDLAVDSDVPPREEAARRPLRRLRRSRLHFQPYGDLNVLSYLPPKRRSAGTSPCSTTWPPRRSRSSPITSCSPTSPPSSSRILMSPSTTTRSSSSRSPRSVLILGLA